jgi:hypothetical protein
MRRLFSIFIGISLLLGSSFIASFLFTSLDPIADRSLIEGAAEQQNPLEAVKKLDQTARNSLMERERAALKREPMDTGALQNLIVLEELKGENDKAKSIALALANFIPREPGAQLPAMQIDLASQNYQSAFSRLDGTLRARPDLKNVLFGLLFSQVSSDLSRQELAKLLANGPPWRSAFLSSLLENEPSGAAAFKVLSDIRKANGELTEREKRSLVQHFYKSKQYEKAYFVWLDFLEKDDLIRVLNIFDGGFETSPKNLQFDWNLTSRKTSRIEVEARSGKVGDGALRLDFFSDKGGGSYVFQTLRLQPSQYRLTYEVQVEELKNETGLVWRLACVESGKVFAESPPIREKGPWEKRELLFDLPDADCATQILKLENKSAARLDQEISGRIAFDNIAIEDPSVSPEKQLEEKTDGQQ